MTLQVTHRIAEDIDAERDHIVATLTAANPAVDVDSIRHFASGYHARNGGGDAMVTDGDLPVVDLRPVAAAASAAPEQPTDSRDKRPSPTVFGAGVAGMRGVLSAIVAVGLLGDPSGVSKLAGDVNSSSHAAIAFAVVAVVDLVLAVSTYRGRNWSRILLLLFSATTICIEFVSSVRGSPRPTLGSGLPVIALGILVLLALTSDRSREYALRRSGTPAG